MMPKAYKEKYEQLAAKPRLNRLKDLMECVSVGKINRRADCSGLYISQPSAAFSGKEEEGDANGAPHVSKLDDARSKELDRLFRDVSDAVFPKNERVLPLQWRRKKPLTFEDVARKLLTSSKSRRSTYRKPKRWNKRGRRHARQAARKSKKSSKKQKKSKKGGRRESITNYT